MSVAAAGNLDWSGSAPIEMPDSKTVHLWRATLNPTESLLEKHRNILRPEELSRAARFKFNRHRNSYITARSQLRRLLSLYLSVPSEKIELLTTIHGKPYVQSPKLPKLQFNLSHSHDRVVYAIGSTCDLGIDIEWIKPGFADSGIPERFFSSSEVAALRSVSLGKQAEAFFNCWTRKEAIIKAIGQGLSLPLDAFDVSLKPGEPARVLDMRIPQIDQEFWQIWDINVDTNYKAALALQGDVAHLRSFDCDLTL
ncbi:MAG: 4'-phosphopantetheinyl transferase family protein [Calditrichia bacterium]